MSPPKKGPSPHLAEVSMPPPAPLLFQCGAPKAGNTIEPNIATTTTVKKSAPFKRRANTRAEPGSLVVRRATRCVNNCARRGSAKFARSITCRFFRHRSKARVPPAARLVLIRTV
ncbi:hypothetical protein ACJJTC_011801 [Scirpophaga incertulas]